MRVKFKVFLTLTLITYSSATLGPSKTKKAKQKSQQELKINEGPVSKNVFQRDLVDIEPLASRIVSEGNTYYQDTTIKNFNGTVLGYVTPVRKKSSIAHQILIFNNF